MKLNKYIALTLSIVLAASALMGCAKSSAETPSSQASAKESSAVVRTAAVLPDRKITGDAMQFIEGDAYSKWWEETIEYRKAAIEINPDLNAFYSSTVKPFLTSDNENRVYSPLNVYFALAVLAETAGGNTRKQILDLTGAADIQSLKSHMNTLWQANYQDNPILQSILSNSIWLRNDINYNQNLLDTLAADYYVDSFVGEMGSDEINSAMREWTDDATGNLLSEYTQDMETDPMTVMEMISTIYFHTNWINKFNKDLTDRQTFHGASGDTECDMMHSTYQNAYYYCDNFAAVGLGLAESGGMYLVLPDEGVSIDDVLDNEQLLKLVTSRGMSEDLDYSYALINLSLPKFNVHSRLDLKKVLSDLGVTDAFDAQAADFTQLTDEVHDIFISKADHAAMVQIDEEGVTGAAYVDLAYAGAAMPEDEVDFVLDRPFLFFIASSDGSILFAGSVYDLE